MLWNTLIHTITVHFSCKTVLKDKGLNYFPLLLSQDAIYYLVHINLCAWTQKQPSCSRQSRVWYDKESDWSLIFKKTSVKYSSPQMSRNRNITHYDDWLSPSIRKLSEVRQGLKHLISNSSGCRIYYCYIWRFLSALKVDIYTWRKSCNNTKLNSIQLNGICFTILGINSPPLKTSKKGKLSLLKKILLEYVFRGQY